MMSISACGDSFDSTTSTASASTPARSTKRSAFAAVPGAVVTTIELASMSTYQPVTASGAALSFASSFAAADSSSVTVYSTNRGVAPAAFTASNSAASVTPTTSVPRSAS